MKPDHRVIGWAIMIFLFFASVTANVAMAASRAAFVETRETTNRNAADISVIKGDIRVIRERIDHVGGDILEIKNDVRGLVK